MYGQVEAYVCLKTRFPTFLLGYITYIVLKKRVNVG